MAPLIVLVLVTLLARLAGRLGVGPLRDWAAATRMGLAVMFCIGADAPEVTARFRDPAGNVIGLYQEPGRKGGSDAGES